MKMNIDLGQGMEGATTAPSSKSEPQKYYPSFTYSGDAEMDLPDEGEMTIEFRKVRSSETKSDGGKERYECTVEIRKIISVDGDEQKAPATNRGKETEDALDALVKAHTKSKY